VTETQGQATLSPHFGREATASTYRDIHLPRVFTPWAAILLEIVPPRPGQVVLDVATGPGTIARPAALKVGSTGRVVGVDVSGAMLAVARGFPSDDGAAPIEYVEASATQIPRDSNTFDVAFCQQGLQHMADPMQALQEIKRLLKPGGRVGVAVWQQSPFGLFREAVADLNLPSEGAHPSGFGREPAHLLQALRDTGFTNVEVQQRRLESVLEGGVEQGLEVAIATSAGAGMQTFNSEQQAAVREAITRVLEPLMQADGVHLHSVSNIASGECP
jgi:SAM-dependent methyltransferase